MSLFIKGLDLPKEPMLVKINPDGSVSSTAKNGYRKYEAVPVPKHGRMGDLDELEVKHMKVSGDYSHGYYKSTWDYVCAARELIRNAPTIIEAE